MIVTPRLAHGAVREAVRSNCEKLDSMVESLRQTRIKAPSTYRRFDEWFRKYKKIYEPVALLIVFGKIGRRRGAFSAFTASFAEIGGEWELEIKQLCITFSPGEIEHVALKSLPVTISGHALERMFQRTASIQWSVVRDCLAGATLMFNAAVPAYVAAGCKQCAVPAEKGMLVGQVVDGKLMLRTFLPDVPLQPKWHTLLSDLNAFIADHKTAIGTSALADDEEAAYALKALLVEKKHSWLLEPYAPGVDQLQNAWRSRQSASSPDDCVSPASV
jgi:hypothetical protein